MTGHYRMFIKGFRSISKPLTLLLKKDVFIWTEEASATFMALKEALISAPVLALPDMNDTFVVETDASGLGIGVVLMQKGHPIAFISKALAPKQQVLLVYEKELLVVLLVIKKWHFFLIDRRFIIKTDHRSLKYLLEQKISTPLQHTWLAKLLGYEYEIQYKKGVENKVVDALLRLQSTELLTMTISSVSTDMLDRIKSSYEADPDYSRLIQQIQKGE